MWRKNTLDMTYLLATCPNMWRKNTLDKWTDAKVKNVSPPTTIAMGQLMNSFIPQLTQLDHSLCHLHNHTHTYKTAVIRCQLDLIPAGHGEVIDLVISMILTHIHTHTYTLTQTHILTHIHTAYPTSSLASLDQI